MLEATLILPLEYLFPIVCDVASLTDKGIWSSTAQYTSNSGQDQRTHYPDTHTS